MDAAFAAIGPALRRASTLVFALSVACASARSTTPGTPIGMSDAVPEPAAPAPRGAQVAQPWRDFAAALAWPEAAPAAPALVHRRDGTLVHVRVEPAALAGYRSLSAGSAMPDGARVIAWHETVTGSLLGGYLLEKRAGNWSALELDAHGAVIPGDRSACVRCHDMAPTDHLFGPRAASSPARESIDAERR